MLVLMNCKNCNTLFNDNYDYCFNCGGKVIRKRLSFQSLFQHFVEIFFSYDNSFLKTISHLIKKPEQVIDGYVSGVRKKYLAPFAFFTIALTISGLNFFLINKFYPDFYMDLSNSMVIDERTQNINKSIIEITTEYNSLIYFLLIPFLAVISKLVFLKNKYNFTEHLVIYFYTISFFSITSVILNSIFIIGFHSYAISLNLYIYPIFFIYHCYLLKRLFQLTFKKLIIKILIFIPIIFGLYIFISILTVVILFYTGTLNIEDFKPPQQ